MNQKQKPVIVMFLIFAIFCKFYAIVIRHLAADLSLWGNTYAPPGTPLLPYFVSYNPEGRLWQLLNPIQLGLFPYTMYCYLVDMALLSIQLVLCKKGKIPLEIIAFNQVFGLEWYIGFGHELQNITLFSILPFMYLLPEVGILSILQKFPIGYYPIIDNPQVYCMLHCAFGNIFLLYLWRSINYAVLLIAFFNPLLARRREGKNWFPILRWLKR